MAATRTRLLQWLTFCVIAGSLAAGSGIIGQQIVNVVSERSTVLGTMLWTPMVLLMYPGYVASVLLAGHMDAGFGDFRDDLCAFAVSGLFWGSALFGAWRLIAGHGRLGRRGSKGSAT